MEVQLGYRVKQIALESEQMSKLECVPLAPTDPAWPGQRVQVAKGQQISCDSLIGYYGGQLKHAAQIAMPHGFLLWLNAHSAIDGLHASGIAKWMAKGPGGNVRPVYSPTTVGLVALVANRDLYEGDTVQIDAPVPLAPLPPCDFQFPTLQYASIWHVVTKSVGCHIANRSVGSAKTTWYWLVSGSPHISFRVGIANVADAQQWAALDCYSGDFVVGNPSVGRTPYTIYEPYGLEPYTVIGITWVPGGLLTFTRDGQDPQTVRILVNCDDWRPFVYIRKTINNAQTIKLVTD